MSNTISGSNPQGLSNSALSHDRLHHGSSAESRFEAAADAIVQGDAEALTSLLRDQPSLVHARSSREHRATLLHYVAANGVENYRLRTPANAVAIAQILLQAGAEVDATAEMYGGSSTTFALVATSSPPRQAGVQLALMEKLLDSGATIQSAGSFRPLIHACLGNGHPAAAEWIASRFSLDAPPLDAASAAALGRLDRLQELADSGQLLIGDKEVQQGFLWTCAYGQEAVAAYLLDGGMNRAAQDKWGQTGLHLAAMDHNVSMAALLLRSNAPMEVLNSYGGTPLGQALWSASNLHDPTVYLPMVKSLLDAGAAAPEPFPDLHPALQELLSRYQP